MKNTDLLAALCEASERGDTEKVRQALAQGAPVNGKTEYGLTAVGLAIQNLHQQTLELLVSSGANINALDDDGEHPLMYVFKNDQVSKGMDGEKTRMDPSQQMSILRTALRLGADPQARGEFGQPVLHEAAREFPLPAVIELVATGMDPSLSSRYGKETMLHVLAERKLPFDDIFRTLVNVCVAKGAPVDAKNQDGQTPEELALLHDNTAFAEHVAALASKPSQKARRPGMR